MLLGIVDLMNGFADGIQQSSGAAYEVLVFSDGTDALDVDEVFGACIGSVRRIILGNAAAIDR
jgi:hypothetical protein